MFYKFHLILFVFLYPVFIQTSRNRYLFDVQNVTCSRKSEQLKLMECDWSNKKPGNSLINFRFMLDRNIGKDSEVHIELFVQPFSGKPGYNFLDFKVNACDAISRVFENRLFKGILDAMRRSSNLPYKCPFKANVLYHAENLSFDTNVLPLYARGLTSVFTLTIINRGELLTAFKVNCTIKPKN